MTTVCSLCGSVSHKEDSCLVGAHFAPPPEDVNYLGNTYNPGWRNHPNLSWGRRQGNQYSGGQNNVYKPPHLQNQGGYKPERKEPVPVDPLKARVAKMEGELATLKTSSKNVESQLSQLISMMS